MLRVLIVTCLHQMVAAHRGLAAETGQLSLASDVLSSGFELCSACDNDHCLCDQGSENNNSDRRPYTTQVGHGTRAVTHIKWRQSTFEHGYTTAVILCDELLWKQTHRDVTTERLVVSCRYQTCSILI